VAFRVAVSGDRVDGFVLVGAPGSGFPSDPPGAAYLSLLAVRPAAQGRGLGRALLAAAEADSAAVVDEVVLHVLSGNATARALYEVAGWSRVGPESPHPLSGEPMLTLRRPLVG
jgi:ribosomal protein S18 acetylase RimI-like enzyme